MGNPLDPEEILTISDQNMVFSSTEPSSPKQVSNKTAKKMAKAKVKLRRSTPAPPTKDNGRKRVVPSPLPEDKQLRKRIDFGEEDGRSPGSPKCKAAIFPASPLPVKGLAPELKDLDQDGNKVGMEEATSSNGMEIPLATSPCSGQNSDYAAGEVPTGPEVKDVQPSQDKSKVQAAAKAKGIFGEEEVKLPEMAMETKLLLESSLVPFQAENSRDELAVGGSLQPKTAHLLELASLDGADMLDAMAAQPLLDAGLVTVGRMEIEPPYDSQLVNDQNLLSPSSAFSPYHAEFPPLEKGRTLKIRDSFETGSSSYNKNMAGPRKLPRGQVHGSAAPSTNAGLGNGVINKVLTNIPTAETSEGTPIASPKSNGMDEMPRTNSPAPSNGNGPNLGEGSGSAGTRETQAGGAEKPAQHNKTWHTMADMLKGAPDPNGPQVFVAEKIQNIGFASVSNGIPSIYFSGTEIRKLADNVGHAIVGKFSHSIPTALQIQKALDKIKFCRGYTWKYINAKHILIQCEDLADYARLLGGPKGTPVWFIDRHPMRVFKWSPDFDAYCESPIAAIWCNLIGLPIHLFDHSALFAIGKLLGNPIQVDKATANKSRLSFARICVEIDITKPPTEEIILDICGKETTHQVRWDKIPAYCRECKHVGH